MASRTPHRRHSMPTTTSFDSMYTTPLFAKLTSFEELLFAPRKKKSVVMTRRRSAPASFLDFRDIRKKLDFELSNDDTRVTITRGKRKYSPDSPDTRRTEITSAFSDLTITPKSTKRVKFLAEVKSNEYECDDFQQPSSSKSNSKCLYLKTSPINLNHTDEDSEDITPESGSLRSFPSRKKKCAKRSDDSPSCKINRRLEIEYSDYLGDSESSHFSA